MVKQRIRRLESLVRRCGRDAHAVSPPLPRRLETSRDVLELLHEQVEALRADTWADPVEKARAIARLVELARKAMETDKLSTRVELLMNVLKQRKGAGSQ